MISINTNLSSLITQSNLKRATNGLNQAIERMSTGFKINGAKDNAANHSINTQLTTKIGAYQVAEENTAMGMDMLNTASSSLDQISDLLSRLRALQEQAMNGTYGQESLDAINLEANAIVDEIERLYGTTEYNGVSLFGKSSDTITEAGLPTVGEDGFIQTVAQRNTDSMTKLSSVSETTTISSGTYSISTAEELAKLATMTNNGNIGAGAEFVLANDIDLSAYSSGEGWVPIGIYGNTFKATFDGNGYTVSNLTINRPEAKYQGLFGYVFRGSIKNLGMDNIEIQGKGFLGGLAGVFNFNKMTNCFVKNAIINGTTAGGLIAVAMNAPEITNCYVVNTNVTGSSAIASMFGNISGNNGAIISNCFSSGCSVNLTGTNSAGGLIGWGASSFQISNSYTITRINNGLSLDTGAFIGGYGANINIDNCYYDSSINPSLNGIGYGVIPDTLKDLVKPVDMNLQIGINGDASSSLSLQTSFDLSGMNLRMVGIEKYKNYDLLSAIDDLLARVTAKQTEFGAAQNRLESALEEISIQYENLVSSRSTIRDADIAEESSSYIKMQILQQASATLLATANQTPSIALQLL